FENVLILSWVSTAPDSKLQSGDGVRQVVVLDRIAHQGDGSVGLIRRQADERGPIVGVVDAGVGVDGQALSVDELAQPHHQFGVVALGGCAQFSHLLSSPCMIRRHSWRLVFTAVSRYLACLPGAWRQVSSSCWRTAYGVP